MGKKRLEGYTHYQTGNISSSITKDITSADGKKARELSTSYFIPFVHHKSILQPGFFFFKPTRDFCNMEKKNRF